MNDFKELVPDELETAVHKVLEKILPEHLKKYGSKRKVRLWEGKPPSDQTRYRCVCSGYEYADENNNGEITHWDLWATERENGYMYWKLCAVGLVANKANYSCALKNSNKLVSGKDLDSLLEYRPGLYDWAVEEAQKEGKFLNDEMKRMGWK